MSNSCQIWLLLFPRFFSHILIYVSAMLTNHTRREVKILRYYHWTSVWHIFRNDFFASCPFHLKIWFLRRSLRFCYRAYYMWSLQGNNIVRLRSKKEDHLLAELWQLSQLVTAWCHQSPLQKQPFLEITNTCKVTTECKCNASRLYDLYNVVKVSNDLEILYQS
jgi:hypothetical protein